MTAADMGTRLTDIGEMSAKGMDPKKTHPLFSATHSMVLAQRYGVHPLLYQQNPELRKMDTRMAALETLQALPEGIQRYRASRPEQSRLGALRTAVGRPVVKSAATAPTPPVTPAKTKMTPPPSNWIG